MKTKRKRGTSDVHWIDRLRTIEPYKFVGAFFILVLVLFFGSMAYFLRDVIDWTGKDMLVVYGSFGFVVVAAVVAGVISSLAAYGDTYYTYYHTLKKAYDQLIKEVETKEEAAYFEDLLDGRWDGCSAVYRQED